MACARPWNYALMGKEAKASADAAYIACQQERTARIEARQERRVAVAEATGTTGGQIIAGAVGDVLDTAANVGAAFFGGVDSGSLVAPVTVQAPPPVVESAGVVDWIRANPVPTTAIGVALVGAAYLATR